MMSVSEHPPENSVLPPQHLLPGMRISVLLSFVDLREEPFRSLGLVQQHLVYFVHLLLDLVELYYFCP